MDENKRYEGEDIKLSSPFLKWLENFWYHYKWHTVAALFIIFVLVFCILQTCSRTKYDIHVMYAGGTNISRAEVNGESEFRDLSAAFGRFVGDFDGDGERGVNLSALFLPSDEEIREIESRNDGTELNYTLIGENDEIFRQSMLYGDYYIVILSESLFREWTKDEKNNPFAPMAQYLPEDVGLIMASDYGVYLSSTPLRDNPGFKELDEGSIIAMRKFTTFGTQYKGDKATEFYKFNEEVLRRMLKDEAY